MLRGVCLQSRIGIGAAVALAAAVMIRSFSAAAMPAPPDMPFPPLASHSDSEPFGLAVTAVPSGPLHDKWQQAEAAIANDMRVLAACADRREACPSPAALRLLTIADNARGRSGIARLGEANRAINLAIRSVSDEAQYGVEDLWASPLMTLASGAGDCEDYAIAKYAVLQLAGFSADDLRIVILRHTTTQEDHAVLAVRMDAQWLLLDNRHMALVRAADLAGYRPLFVADARGTRRFEAVPVVAASRPSALPMIDDETLRKASMYFAPDVPTGPAVAVQLPLSLSPAFNG